MKRLNLLSILLAAAATHASAADLQPKPRAEFFAHVPAERRLVDADRNRVFDNLEALRRGGERGDG